MSFVFSGSPPQLSCYIPAVQRRLATSYQPSTLAAHRLACITLARFCHHHRLPFPSITISILLAFLEFLHSSSLSVPTIKNYISSIKARFQLAGLDVSPFLSPHLSLSSLVKNAPPVVPNKPIFSS
jgi:hypothetical protein